MTVQEYAVKLRSNISKIIKGKDDKIDLVIMAFQEYSLPPTCYRPILPVFTFSI